MSLSVQYFPVVEKYNKEPGPHAQRKKEEKKEEEEEREEWGEEWGDEGERRCYLLEQEHDSWKVQEREAGEWPVCHHNQHLLSHPLQ